MNTTDFKALCDSTPAEIRTESLHIDAYQEELVRIKYALTPSDSGGVPFNEFKKLRAGFIYLSIIDDSKDFSPYYYILEKINGLFIGSTPRIADWSSQVWKDVIAYVKSLPEYPKTDEFTKEFVWTRERERAKAAKRLTAFGVKLFVKECDLVVDKLDGVYGYIEQVMSEIGGENALKMLLTELTYKKDIGRYLVPHQGNQPMPTFVELELPYGYLFNLSLKHLKDKGTIYGLHHKWEGLKSVLKDYCIAVYNSQKFDIWGDIFFKAGEVVKVVHEMILRFNIYTLPQSGVSFTLAWCSYLCRETMRDARCDILLKDQLARVMRIMNWSVVASSNDKCIHIKKGSIASKLLEANIGGIENLLLIKAGELNADFNTPDDFNKVNGVRFPIVETDDDYILLPKPLVTWNWYEAIYNIIRTNKDKVLAKDIGYVIEGFIHNKVRSHGLTAHTGEYSYSGINGEVDFLVEGRRMDVYIECKKKSLSLKAQAGDDYYIWGDLLEFIESQMQCARLENGVKNHGPIILNDKKTGKSYTYEWKDKLKEPSKDDPAVEVEKKRYVVKVTMTLKEYGPMQDKIVLSNIIKSLIGTKVKAEFDPADTFHNPDDQKSILKAFNKINDALVCITEYYKNIGERPTFFCRFYSMEQIYYMIRTAKSQEHFVELLREKFVTTGTENFWNENWAMENMSQQKV